MEPLEMTVLSNVDQAILDALTRLVQNGGPSAAIAYLARLLEENARIREQGFNNNVYRKASDGRGPVAIDIPIGTGIPFSSDVIPPEALEKMKRWQGVDISNHRNQYEHPLPHPQQSLIDSLRGVGMRQSTPAEQALDEVIEPQSED